LRCPITRATTNVPSVATAPFSPEATRGTPGPVPVPCIPSACGQARPRAPGWSGKRAFIPLPFLQGVSPCSASRSADPSAGTAGPGRLDVLGTHTYAEEGAFGLQVTVTDTGTSSSATTSFVTETNLVTDNPTVLAGQGFAPAAHTDANLKNPWGIAASPAGPF